jgi:hypothetical protein
MQPTTSMSSLSTPPVTATTPWPILTLSSVAKIPLVIPPSHKLAKSVTSPVNTARSHPIHSPHLMLILMLPSCLVLEHSSATAPLSFTLRTRPELLALASRSSLVLPRTTIRLRLLLPRLLYSPDRQLVLQHHCSLYLVP